jgi:hypothetical protein
MMRKLTLAALTLGLAVALGPEAATAARGGFPGGARLHGFRGATAAHSTAKVDTAKSRPKLAGPLDFLNIYTGVPTHPLEYPFLSESRCPSQSTSSLLCGASASSTIGDSVSDPASIVR